MKIARHLAAGMFGLFLIATAAGADPADSGSSSNPYVQTDPDGIPLSVTQPESRQISPDQVKLLRTRQEKADREEDWLLRGYEEQRQNRAASSPDQSANLYYQLSSNRQLARLAGLPALDSGGYDDATSFRAVAPVSDRGAATARADASSSITGATPARRTLFQPLITPLIPQDVTGLRSSFFLPSIPISPTASFSASSAPASDRLPVALSDIETPGLVAAEANPFTATLSDPALDPLPAESIGQAGARPDNDAKPKLPLPMDATQLHKAQTVAAGAPPAPHAAATPGSSPRAQAVSTGEADTAPPLGKVPMINPVRSPIAHPYDILDR